MSEQTELVQHLQKLLLNKRSASLATLTNQGEPFASMVPFAIDSKSANLVIHISEFVAHTRYLQQRPIASVMIATSEQEGKPVHDLSRVTFQVNALPLELDSEEWSYYRDIYLARFPYVEFMTHFKDFHFFTLEITRIRQVAGFGAAKTLNVDEVKALIQAL